MEKESKRETMILKHMGLVSYILKKSHLLLPSSMSLEDALQYGYIGLIEAVDRYHESKGHFSAFAAYRIRGSIMDGVWNYQPISRYHSASYRKKTEEELKSPLMVSEDSKEEAELEDASALVAVEQVEDQILLSKALKSLTYLEAKIIHGHYYEQKSIAEIALELSLSRSWVNRIHGRALNKLKKVLLKSEYVRGQIRGRMVG